MVRGGLGEIFECVLGCGVGVEWSDAGLLHVKLSNDMILASSGKV